jgi:hypothetical protein
MSKGKDGQITLTPEQLAAEQRRREREERIRKARDAYQRASARVASLGVGYERARERLRLAEDIVASRAGGASSPQWESARGAARDALARVEAQLAAAREALSAAEASWRRDPERFEAPRLDAIVVPSDLADQALFHARRLAEQAAQGAGASSQASLRAARDALDAYGLDTLAPRLAAELDAAIPAAHDPAAVAALEARIERETERLGALREAWERRHREIQSEVAALQHRFDAETALLREFAPDALATLHVQVTLLVAHVAALAGPRPEPQLLDEALARHLALSAEVERAIDDAAEAEAQERIRRRTVGALVGALQSRGFDVAADLAADGPQAGRVVVEARSADGRHMAFRVAPDQQIEMDLDDGGEVDCVADLADLARRLAGADVALEVFDYGSAAERLGRKSVRGDENQQSRQR